MLVEVAPEVEKPEDTDDLMELDAQSLSDAVSEIPPLSPTDEVFEEIDVTDSADFEDENGQEDIDSLFEDFNFPDDDITSEEEGGLDGLFASGDEPSDEDAANSQDDIDGLFDEPDAGESEENGQDDIDNLFDAVDDESEESDENSQDDIDGLFDNAPDVAAEADEDAEAVATQNTEEQAEASSSDDLDDPFDNPEIVAEVEDLPGIVSGISPAPFWKRIDKKVAMGWAGYGVALILFVMTIIMARVSVVSVAPAMANLYSAIGFPVNVRGIIFTNVQQRWRTVDGQIQLQVEGEVANLTNRYKPLPSIIIGGLSNEHREVFRWTAKVREKPLLPGEKALFKADIPAPPETTRHLLLRFEDK